MKFPCHNALHQLATSLSLTQSHPTPEESSYLFYRQHSRMDCLPYLALCDLLTPAHQHVVIRCRNIRSYASMLETSQEICPSEM